ncbi:MAG: hypothetical protein ACXAC5_11440 [Promethearchaeota archaeon]|jgi:hypothetical protein
MVLKDEAKSERKRLYFDLICGAVCSITALSGIIFVFLMYGITDMAGWLTGLTFWIIYLIFSLFLISIGLYTRWKEKHFDDRPPRTDLKPPIV